MRRLILHIGPHKTGTTSFQHWLRDSAPVLANSGLAVPVGLLPANANGGPLARALLADPKEQTPAQAQLVADFEQFCIAHPRSSVILSAELFSRLLYNDRTAEDDEDDRDDAEKQRYARHLCTATSALGFDRIDLILLIRDQVGFLTSAYIQKLKTMNARWEFSKRPLEHMPVRRYLDSFAHLSGMGFNITAAPYSDPKDTRLLPERLIDLAGFRDTLRDRVSYETAHENVSPGFLTMIGLGHVFWNIESVKDNLEPGTWRGLRHDMFGITRKLNVEGDGPLTLFAPDQAARISTRQRRHLNGIEPWTKGLTGTEIADRFPTHGPQSPLSRSALSPDQRRRVTQWLNTISAAVKRSDRLGGLLDHAKLTDLDASPAGVHSAQPHAAPCLGGVWAALAPDGRWPTTAAH